MGVNSLKAMLTDSTYLDNGTYSGLTFDTFSVTSNG